MTSSRDNTSRPTGDAPPGRAWAGTILLLVVSCSGSSGNEGGPPDIVLNEILTSNRSTLIDEDGRSSDWIELLNRGGSVADLAGFTLSNDPESPAKWTFPAILVPPGGRLLVWASGKDRHAIPTKTLLKASVTTPFPESFLRPADDRRMKAPGAIQFRETYIRAGDTWRYITPEPGAEGPPAGWTAVSFDDSDFLEGPSGFGYADDDDATLLPEGTTAVFARRKFHLEDPNHAGQLVLKVDYDDGFVAYLNGVRVAAMNSLVEHPEFATVASDKHEPGRPELFDLTPHAGCLRAGENVLAIVGLNAGPIAGRPSSDMSLIPELGSLAIVPHTSFELAAEGGELCLRDPKGRVVDGIVYPRQAEDRSFGRSPDGTGKWAYFAVPTPREANTHRPFAMPPTGTVVFDPAPGFHPEPLEARIRLETSVPGTEIRFTTDGAVPTGRSPAAEGSFDISESTVFRAAGFAGDEQVTPVVSASYFIGSPLALPVLSISMDPQVFARTHIEENAHGRPSEGEANFEMFDPTGARSTATRIGLRLHGGYGRKGGITTKKSYRLYFRNFYGDSALSSPLIPGIAPGKLDKLVLRANFNDRLGAYFAGAAMVRDQVARDIHRDMGALVSSGAWCILYVNMQFKGLYNVVERLDEEFLRRHLGKGPWDMVKTGNVVVCGSRVDWDALHRYVLGHDLSQKEYYEEVKRRVDLENFTSYLILNLWSQNEDWPHNNWYAARKQEPGSKWIFLSWDVEWGMGHTPQGYKADSITRCLEKTGPVRDLFAALLKNEEYRDFFKKEAARHVSGALSHPRVLEHVTRNAQAIDAFMPAELKAFAPWFTREMWRRNVTVVGNFAARRGAYFLRHLDRVLASGPPEDAPLAR